MTSQWYAMCSKLHKEDALWRQLQAFSIDVFFPRYLLKTGQLNMMKIKPYFPGYLFIRADLDQIGVNVFQRMPFSTGLVLIGERPAGVPEVLIQAIRKRVERMNASVGEFLNSIGNGSQNNNYDKLFSGRESIFDVNIDGGDRVIALLSVLEEVNSVSSLGQ